MPSASELSSHAKTILRGEVQEFSEDLAHAKSELLQVQAWRDEIQIILGTTREATEALALQRDIEDLAQYLADLKREVMLLNQRILDRRSLALGLKAKARQIRASEVSAHTSQKHSQLEPQLKTPAQLVSASQGLTLCIRCNTLPAAFGGRKRHLYCKSCKPPSLGSSLFANLKSRRKALESSISTKWPDRFVGLAFQGGAPGLGKKA